MTRHVSRLRQIDNAEIVAIARRNQEALDDAREELGIEKAYIDWRELIEQPNLDAVIASTAHHAHMAPTVAALE